MNAAHNMAEGEFTQNLHLIAVRFFDLLLSPVLQGLSKQFCSEEWAKLSKFFRTAFGLAQVSYKHNGKCELPKVDDVERAVVEAFQRFVIKLNEDQLGPVILKLVKWANKSSKNLYGDSALNWHRQIISFKALNGVVEQLGEYSVPFLRL